MIRMVDLYGQYLSVKDEMDAAIARVMAGGAFVRGPQVGELESELAAYVGVAHCVACGSGTDALRLAMAAIGIGRGDEVIVPAFTFGAVAESVASHGGIPVFADVDPLTFNLDPRSVERLITGRTRAIVPVHMFGQPCDMPPLYELARRHGLAVVEDNAQSFGACCRSEGGGIVMAGGAGLIGCTSFFPTKVLGCYGDGGAVFTDDGELARRMRVVANHGQTTKYNYSCVGLNSRLDTLQAAVLGVKLRHLPEWIESRVAAAGRYDAALSEVAGVECPVRAGGVSHVYHQYTLSVDPALRDGLKSFLAGKGIETMVYYPSLLSGQEAWRDISRCDREMRGALSLPGSVLSLPVCSHIGEEAQMRVAAAIKEFMAANARGVMPSKE